MLFKKNFLSLSIICSIFCFSLFVSASALYSFNTADNDYFAGFKARSIGPAGMSGRIAAIEVVANNPKIIYIGAATGGLWKSINGGITWKPIFDDQPTSSIGDVTVDPINPEIVWAGTGEANPRNSAGVGRGIFKTVDGGQSWKFLGLEKTERISRILLDPQHPQIAYVAAMGTAWGENPERGVYKTEDGGQTWKKILYVDQKTGAADLVMDPSNPNRLLAAMWQYRRWPWYFKSGGPGSGLYITTDGGQTWKRLTHKDGLPEGNLGRIGLAFSRSRPNIVYALVEAEKSALCRSENSGQTWKIVNNKPGVSPRPFYFSDIRVHPAQENTIYRLAGSLEVSIDGGKSFKSLMPFSAVHGDFQDLWIHPHDGEIMVVGGDGGIGISYDQGQHWNFVQNLPVGQFYHISVDMEQPYNIYGGMQDNGSWRGPSRVLSEMGIFNFYWTAVGGGDGFGTLPSPENSKIGYSMSQGGYLTRFNIETGEEKDIRPPSPEGVRLRFNWNAAIAVDPFDPQILYYGSQFLHKSRDGGQTWEIISPDLTTNDPAKEKQAESGGLTRDVTFAENYCTIITIAPSPVQKGVIWVGTDDGQVQLTKDGGHSWQNLSSKFSARKRGLVPARTWVPHIEASHHEAGTAYVVFDDHRRANWTPYVFMTKDFGQSWQSIVTSDIDGFAHVIREDPAQKNLLFLGTEFGLYLSFDRGKNWMKWTSGLPTVPVRDLIIHPGDNDLIIGTHGRSIYILDDIQPLGELSEEIKAKKFHLFSVANAYQFRTSFYCPGYLTPGDMEFQGKNRPYGAFITYSLGKLEAKKSELAESGEGITKNKEEDLIEIEILDSSDKVVRKIKGPKKYGLNRVNWDLRRESFKSVRKPEEDFFPQRGPFVLPGTYTVRLKLGQDIAEKTFQVLADPRSPVSSQDRQQKYEMIMKNGHYLETVTAAYKKLEEGLKAVNEVLKRIDQLNENKRQTISTKAKAIKEKLKTFSLELAPPKDRSGIFEETELASLLASLGYRLESSFDAPTAGQIQEFKKLEAAVKEKIKRINIFFEKEFQKFAEEVKQAGFSVFPEFKPIVIKE